MEKNAKELKEYTFEYIRKYASVEDIIKMFEDFVNENPNGAFINESLSYRDYMINQSQKEKED